MAATVIRLTDEQKQALLERTERAVARGQQTVIQHYNQIRQVIDATPQRRPIIVNERSNFVVVTYWWGHGNNNRNTARPCISFYEDIIKEILHFLEAKPNLTNYRTLIESDEGMMRFLKKEGAKYVAAKNKEIKNRKTKKEKANARLQENDSAIALPNMNLRQTITGMERRAEAENAFQQNNTLRLGNVLQQAENRARQQGGARNTVGDIVELPIETEEEFVRLFLDALYTTMEREEEREGMGRVKPLLNDLADLTRFHAERIVLEKQFKDLPKEQTAESRQKLTQIQTRIKQLVTEKATKTEAVKRYITTHTYPLLNERLIYLKPIKINEMIDNWKNACSRAGCNFLEVEYPDFVGRNQLAINAKPRFIQKALELCAPRNVLYIDGDMIINRYPSIFDLTDVDFMARGWNIDPRSSYKHKTSIAVDPYLFETSGGTMFFSQSPESKGLLNAWIQESETISQYKRADDRILSLVFNAKKLLLPMKIIQLPIEYLWLSLDYDHKIEEFQDRNRIYIEHPECLTSEDTAGSVGGAASDRSAKFYAGLGETYPRSEALFEKVMFDTKELRDEFMPYMKYLRQATYFDDLIDECLYGVPPFVVTPFEKGFGKYNPVYDKNLEKLDEIVDPQRRRDMFGHNNGNEVNDSGPVLFVSEMENPSDLIPAILHGLSVAKKPVVYMPNTATQEYRDAVNAFLADARYSRIEFAFVNVARDAREAFFFQSQLDPTQPIVFRPCKQLIQLLSISKDLPSLANLFKNGYQFLSRIRTHYLLAQAPRQVQQGGRNEFDPANLSQEAIHTLYAPVASGGKRKMKYTRKRRAHRARKYKTRRH
jgi:hypothetical protein